MDYLSKDKQVFLGSPDSSKEISRHYCAAGNGNCAANFRSGLSTSSHQLGTDQRAIVHGRRSLIIKSKHEIDHIFSELYSVDERIQVPYFWIKVIELLLFLSLLDGSAVCRPQQFSADISKRTQEVYQYIIENPFSKDTIQDLACMFGLAESSLKRCFKSIAGTSIGAFIKTKRMEAAADMLISEPTLSIGEIGSVAGSKIKASFLPHSNLLWE